MFTPDTFGDSSLLWGLPLALLPLLLYVWQRRRARVVDWPALRFLLQGTRRTIRWMRFGEALLLAVRMSAVALIAYTLARPASLEGDARVASTGATGTRGTVVLIDDSLSTAWEPGGADGSSVWSRLREDLASVLASHRPGDAIWIATLAGGPRPLAGSPFRHPASAARAAEALATRGGAVSILAGLDLSADLFAAARVTERAVFVLTDLQASAWSPEDTARWEFVRSRLAALAPPPRVTVLAPVDPEETPVNRAVVSLEAARSVVGTDREVELIVRARQFGAAPTPEVDLTLSVDDLARATRKVSLSPSEPLEVRFRHYFATPGPHTVSARLGGDGLSFDNERALALEVVDRIPVLIVAGEESGVGRAGDAEYLALALAPHAGEETPPRVLFRPDVHLPNVQLATALHAFASGAHPAGRGRGVVVLANVPVVDAEAVAALEEFVAQGGGLLIFAGNRVEPGPFNEQLFRHGEGVAPARLLERRVAPTGARVHPAAFRLEHPALDPFSQRSRQSLEEIEIRGWYATEPAPGAVPLATVGEEPLIVEHAFGRGRAALVALGVGTTDADLALRPAFLPLVHGLVSYLAAAGAERRVVTAGERVGVELELGAAATPPPHVSLRFPDGSLQALAPRRREGALAFEVETGQPGLYTFFLRRQENEETRVFAANVAADESDLTRIDASELARLARRYGLALRRDRSTGFVATTASAPRRAEHWPWLLAVVLLLVAGETFLTRTLSGAGAREAADRSPATNDAGSTP